MEEDPGERELPLPPPLPRELSGFCKPMQEVPGAILGRQRVEGARSHGGSGLKLRARCFF